jgi:putative DNA primase/helicase
MADRNNNSARVYNMSQPPSDDDAGAPPAEPGGRGGQATRQKRKKKVDTGKLQTLFRRWVFQFASQIVWDTETLQPYALAGLRNQYGNDEVKLWMTSEKRRDVRAEQVVFDPAGKCGPECINLFGGLEMVPMTGNCQPIIDLLYHLCDSDEDVRDWILDWIAYPLQNPGAKMPTSVIMHGDEGSGKNLFWEIVGAIYGPYASVVGQDQLESKFNDYLSRKLFLIGDEVLSRQEMRHLKGKLKAMISGKTLQIETKMMPVRAEANHVNMVFLSNELQPNALDASDRRYCVVWTPPKQERAYYKAVADCAENGGREALYDFLLKRDLSAFDPHGPAPGTVAKAELIDLGRPNPERFFIAWRSGALPVPFHSCSSAQAFRLYKKWASIEGERFTSAQNYFSRQVLREARDTIKVKLAKTGAAGQVVRMWLVTGAQDGSCTLPPDDVAFGAWAADTVDSFEQKLKGYIGEV